MEKELQIPKRVEDLSRSFRIIWLGQVTKRTDPWKNITGKLKIGQKIDIEKLLEERGFENE